MKKFNVCQIKKYCRKHDLVYHNRGGKPDLPAGTRVMFVLDLELPSDPITGTVEADKMLWPKDGRWMIVAYKVIV